MPVRYDRDDARRLITVTVTDPYKLDEILGVINRQAAERAWEYAMLFDLRTATNLTKLAEAQGQLLDRVRLAGGARQRGPVGLAIAPRSDDFRAGLQDAQRTTGVMDVEVLITATQVDGWLTRHGR